ncbi:uncharacterized protein IL334_001209 [Kwoniella shivajii]|uniref:Uncharacterized protein n=1 Tax=Kwoniella shivajii TaxID=564305 RepID=A0ABZ1CRG5_9TREE|nr:hypothetical protein IL334_001209 [Kwoniella shivajii]
MGAVTTLTIVALIADVGHEHVAIATSCYPAKRTWEAYRRPRGKLLQQFLAKIQTIASIRESSASIRYLQEPLKSIAMDSYQKALHAVFICAIVLSVVYLLAGLGIREIDMHAKPERVEDVEEVEEVDA